MISNDFSLFLQRVVTGVLNGTIREWSMKDTQVMVAIIGLLAGELDPGSQYVRTNDDLRTVVLLSIFLLCINVCSWIKYLSGLTPNARTKTLVCHLVVSLGAAYVYSLWRAICYL